MAAIDRQPFLSPEEKKFVINLITLRRFEAIIAKLPIDKTERWVYNGFIGKLNRVTRRRTGARAGYDKGEIKMKTTSFGQKVSEKSVKNVLSLWRNGKNIWEISQTTSISEAVVAEIVQNRVK